MQVVCLLKVNLEIQEPDPVAANANGIFSPVITLTLFAIISKYRGDGKFDADTAFTAIALLAMVTHPANMIMTIIPRAVASLANFERVQDYLLDGSIKDHRLETETTYPNPQDLTENENQESSRAPAVIADKMTLQYSPKSKAVLQDISFRVEAGSVTMCAGPVGTGKTTLAKAILGEICPSSGSISVSTKRIGLCSQTPWLPSGSIKEVVCGSASDPLWYDTVLEVCDLKTDLKVLPQYDETQIGSRGVNLSGGQRQRVVCFKYLPSSLFVRLLMKI